MRLIIILILFFTLFSGRLFATPEPGEQTGVFEQTKQSLMDKWTGLMSSFGKNGENSERSKNEKLRRKLETGEDVTLTPLEQAKLQRAKERAERKYQQTIEQAKRLKESEIQRAENRAQQRTRSQLTRELQENNQK